MRLFLLFLLAFATSVLAAPAPKPAWPTSLVLTQGTQTQRFLTVPNEGCSRAVKETRVSGVRRFQLANCAANGSFVQFPENGGPIYSQWVYPIPPPPANEARTQDCSVTNPGTTGTWTQTHGWTWDGTQYQPQPWTPDSAPAGACTAVQPPPGVWQAPAPGSTFPILPKPAKGGSFVGPYGMVTTRITDHTADVSQPWLAVWYNRHQAFNADNTMFVVFQPNGFWDVYSTANGAFLKHLNGPAGDCEFQWDLHDPNAALFLPINGGSVFRKMDVAANTNSVYWDFTTAARAIFPNATRYWTKSEGSPSADGRYWGLMAEADNFSAVYGFIKVDIIAKTIVWSMPNPNGTTVPDNVTISPSGRWFVVSGLAPVGTKAYAADGSGTVRTLHHGVEHAEIGALPNGHDFIITENYQANGGPIFAIDIDTGQTLPFVLNIYNNPLFDNPQGQCVNCAVWPSARGLGHPGWVVISTTEHAPSNVFLANVVTNQLYGVTAIYNVRQDYWDEAHCTVSRDLSLMLCTMNFRNTLDNDVYLTRLNPLPQ